METLLEKDVPSYVKDSAYLKSLLNNGPFPDTGIVVPDGCMKKDLNVMCTSNLTELLQTLRFWIVPEVLETSVDFLRFVFEPDNQATLKECAVEYETTLPLVRHVDAIVNSSPVDRVKQAISHGYVFILRFLYDELKCEVEGGILMAAAANQVGCLEYFHSRGEPLTAQLAAAAAKANGLQCLMYIHDIGGVCDFSTALCAATNGSLECVKFLVENGGRIRAKHLDKLLYNASKAGHLPVVEYLWDACSGSRTPSSEYRVSYPAASRGHVPLLQFAHARSFAEFAAPPNSAEGIITSAAESGQLRSVDFLYSVGQRADAQVLTSAAHAGNVLLVRFLLEHNCPVDPTQPIADFVMREDKTSFEEVKLLFDMGVPWDTFTMAALAEKGDLEGMMYLRERGCPWDEKTCGSAASKGHLECLRYARENGCPWSATPEDPLTAPLFQSTIVEEAASAPTADCLKYVVEYGLPVIYETVIHALQHQSLPVVKYLLSVGCPLDARVSEAAVKIRNPTGPSRLEFLRLLHEHHCPWDERTCCTAARRRDLECLRFAHENGCPWDATVCAAAASKGNMECLQFAHTNGCPWDEMTCAGAAAAKSYECLQYARDRGCPWDARTCAAAASYKSVVLSEIYEVRAGLLRFLKFVREQDCPWDQETFRKAKSRAVYEYAVAHGCPGAELSVYHNPAYDDDDHRDQIMYMLGF